MNICLKPLLVVFGILFWMTAYSLAQAATYYVASTGNNANPGTISQPFATLQKAHDVANPGDTIYMRGGTYPIATQTIINRSGTAGNYINVLNYPGETPVLDGSGNSNVGGYANIRVEGSYWKFKGLEIANGPGYGIYLVRNASNITIELCNVHHNLRLDSAGGGINIENGNNILVLNNDTHHNGRIGTEGGTGINMNSQASNNIIRGNRIWRNNDNGIALWNAANVLVENNWVWENGFDDTMTHYEPGDGIGFKLGGAGTGDGNHIVRNNLAWRNYGNGFDDNSADIPMKLYNNTAYNNGTGIGGNGANFAFYTNIANVLRNNVAENPDTYSFAVNVIQDHNSWNGGVTVSSAQFVTVDFTANLGRRQADGSLPFSNFLRLVAGSNLIDKGVDVGIAYTGSAPDLGAYEYTTSAVSLQAPSNLVVRP